MGHANRPRLYDAFGLDAQPRCLCLSSGWKRYTNTNTNRKSYSDGNTHGNSQRNTDTEADAHAENCADAEAASNTGPAAIARN